jgi:hypothetical protein
MDGEKRAECWSGGTRRKGKNWQHLMKECNGERLVSWSRGNEWMAPGDFQCCQWNWMKDY